MGPMTPSQVLGTSPRYQGHLIPATCYLNSSWLGISGHFLRAWEQQRPKRTKTLRLSAFSHLAPHLFTFNLSHSRKLPHPLSIQVQGRTVITLLFFLKTRYNLHTKKGQSLKCSAPQIFTYVHIQVITTQTCVCSTVAFDLMSARSMESKLRHTLSVEHAPYFKDLCEEKNVK